MTPKQSRTIKHALDRLYVPKSWMAIDLEAIRRLGSFPEMLAREFQVRCDGGKMMLTDSGLDHFKSLVSTLDEVNLFDRGADYSDLWSVCKQILEELLQSDQQPESTDEFVQLVLEQVRARIQPRVFVVSLYGICLTDIDSLEVGRFHLAKPSADLLEAQGISDRRGSLPALIKQMGEHHLWFLGSMEATERVARRELFNQARLTAGLFAILAAACYHGGAEGFRIGAITSPEEARAPVSVYLSWTQGGGWQSRLRKADAKGSRLRDLVELRE